MPTLSKELKLSADHQRFSLPENFVFYMAKNPLSPKVYEKLIRCCKYFWLKNPIITLYELKSPDVRMNYWRAEAVNGFHNETQIKMENVNEKCWIYGALDVTHCLNKFLASSLISKIYRSDLTHLNLSFQSITFAEFKMFASSGSLESLYLCQNAVKNSDESIVPIEKLIELLPNLLKFEYWNVRGNDGLQTITSETAAKLVELPHFPQIERFEMFRIPESFDIDAFFATPKVSNLICFASVFSQYSLF